VPDVSSGRPRELAGLVRALVLINDAPERATGVWHSGGVEGVTYYLRFLAADVVVVLACSYCSKDNLFRLARELAGIARRGVSLRDEGPKTGSTDSKI
jgi:hypothetical protein